MNSKKGQALVEFIIILPILIFILLAIIDYGTISYSKNQIENIMNEVSSMYKNDESDEEINKLIKDNDKYIKINIFHEEKFINIKLSKQYDYITPGLDKIFGVNEISVERKIYYE